MKLVPLNIMYNTFRERHILYNTRNNSSTKTRDGKTVHSGSEIISYLGHTVWHLIRENIKFWKPNEKKIDSCQKIGFIWNILSIYNLQIDLKHKRYERFSFDLKIKKSVTSMLIIV